ncbi:chromosome segregation protein SMC [Rippkaea orientalis PCC 8801]|uniref:Chromosome partition protein Smc n=1 Tax=Rippkaea orientalis (strain PCC 8801 / RF-1) TaxID=41431 RepID=B7K4Q6_RIPO1|nr:chromosome segregation protein SMC [Rippkaea orientalis]ACK65521.1 chromosome segregation protein SMC [Rippkaea orientalis PCC 8801]
MVHIKRIELSHFKSFGGTTSIPFLTGFTVVSGPNGSGKSNILDALLFCLGLATSKGMRAERLPDLVNHNHSNNRKTQEASVSVTFDVSDLEDLQEFSLNSPPVTQVTVVEDNHSNGHHLPDAEETPIDNKKLVRNSEWTVTRRLRVTKGGSYSSNYYINGEACNVNELHEQLNRLRIYPEGYNVVLQGDVTRIISMNSKERRQIIDELAGVAEFDRKIEKTKETLEEVREREERCQIIQTELQRSLERLAADRIKAEKYQKLRVQVQEKQQWELVLVWKSLQQQASRLQSQITTGEQEATQLKEQLTNLSQQISQTSSELEQLNRQVKALGEDEQLTVASKLATQKAQRNQLEQRQQELLTLTQQNQKSLQETQNTIAQLEHNLTHLTQETLELDNNTIPFLIQQRDRTRQTLEMVRTQANAIAEASDAWVQEQSALSRKITAIQDTLNPQRTQQAKLNERRQQLNKTIDNETQQLQEIETELNSQHQELNTLSHQATTSTQDIQTLAEKLAATEQANSILQETQDRLIKEHREKQRQLDRLEASQQAQQEAQGTYATQLILSSDLPGVCGLVAQLGQVNPRYQLALEIAAGARLTYIVVEDDSIAAAGIELLKKAKAGRATFLPLTKIKSPKIQDNPLLRQSKGFIDLAVNLVLCKPEHSDIFAYVLGNTVVFETLNDARSHLGQQRIVTLEGDILETSGAMTGGSQPKRSNIRFGTVTRGESEELKAIKQRLADLDNLLARNEEKLAQKYVEIKELSRSLTELRQSEREHQLKRQQFEKEIKRLSEQKEKISLQLATHRQELEIVTSQLTILEAEIPVLESQLKTEQQRLEELEQSQTNSEWQEIQTLIKTQENSLQEREQELRKEEERLKDLDNQCQRFREKITEGKQRIETDKSQAINLKKEGSEIETKLVEIKQKIEELESLLEQLNIKLGQTKKDRDRKEETLQSLQKNQQQKAWQLEKLETTQQERKEALITLEEQLESQQNELPEPLPEVPLLAEIDLETTDLTPHIEQLQKEIRNGQKRLEAMEPVNMLALEEHEKTQERLNELTEKLTTLESERTELLLRIENFTTLRFRSFKEAFDAVNENFKTIFATLSDGDGYLQLENEENPFEGGLNLVAHPKGKPVQRLSSMSGGEKSLTALSFIFSLQRYRPSPFYAFDEVDMFLDGANVERLSKMIQQQAKQAQFIVVSLRRPMIEASERTIGVTQARGAYTQVLGIKL